MALEDICFSSISEANEYFLPFRILGSHKVSDPKEYDSFDGWVLWSHTPDENSVGHCSIEERIRGALFTSLAPLEQYSIVQFWAVKRIAGAKCLLTTTHQPFLIDGLEKGYCSYRKECMRRSINVGPEADELQLGPPGRAFRSGIVESCPDVMHYTIQEFPLRDLAIRCGLGVVVSLPLFELGNNNIVGVLEFLCPPDFQWLLIPGLEKNLKGVGLRTDYTGSPGYAKSSIVVHEMNKMFNEVAETHPLALGLALSPCCKEYCINCSGIGCLDDEIADYINHLVFSPDELINISHHIHSGMGVSGRAFASGKSCFCRDIRNFSLLKYPWALHARRAGLTFSVATCVQSIQDVNSNPLVLEFFLLPGSYNIANIRLFTRSLLTRIKELLPSFKVAEDFPGEELIPEISKSLKHDEVDHIEVSHNPLSLPVTPTGCDEFDDERSYLDKDDVVVDFFLPAKLKVYRNIFLVESSAIEESSVDNALVLCSHDAEKCHEVEECIKLVFKRVSMKPFKVDLVQFWASRRIAGRSVLTTFDQPFVLSRQIKMATCLYRKECMRRNIYVDEEGHNEAQLGPAGCAFKNGVAESSPDVRLYTIQEFPLRDHAVLWGIRESMSVPVFEIDGNCKVGVLEVLNTELMISIEYLNCLAMELKKTGLRSHYAHLRPGQSDSLAEIKKTFEEISLTYPLHIARALTLSQIDHCHSNWCLGCFTQEVCYTNPICRIIGSYVLDNLLMASRFHHLQEKGGVVGKALASHRPCFCVNLSNLGITDYPLAHYAKCYGFTFSVSICVQNTQLVDKLCVLELFLLPGDYSTENIGGLLHSLLISVKQLLPSNFKVVSEDVPGEPIFLEIGNCMHVNDGMVATPLDVQGWIDYTMHVGDGTEPTPLVPQGDNSSTIHVDGGTGQTDEGDNNHSPKSFTRQIEGNKFHISLDELKLQFGKLLDEAAKDLGVSRSTLKRIRKSYGIHRWPSHKKNKANQSLFMKENPNHAPHIEEDIMLRYSGTDSGHPVFPMQRSIHSTHDLQTDKNQTVSYGDSEVDKIVTIKASYGHNVFIKFQLNTRSTLQDLQEQVTKRLKWEANRLEIKYQDEAKDWITIIIDEDLQYCLKTSVDRCETTVSMSINLKLD